MKSPRLSSDARGVVFVEHLIAYLPVIFFFLATWQLMELVAAQLMLQRAASAAVRAAIVVMPDDDALYEYADRSKNPKHSDIELAAAMILSHNDHFGEPLVVLDGEFAGSSRITATVWANFRCFAGWASLVCGPGGSRNLTARSTHVYQGASYSYKP